jgi:hypothetical protein
MTLLRNALLAVLTLAALAIASPSTVISTAEATVIGGRPAGCPARYCGCATARKVGLSGSFWNLAANYKVLPRASCAPGMVAARSGHVFVIQACHGNGTVTAYDPNSGGGKTRIHTRSLAGYTIHNPHGGNAYARTGRGQTIAARNLRAQERMQVAWWQGWPHRVLDQQPQYRGRKQYRQRTYQARRYAQPRTRYASAQRRR